MKSQLPESAESLKGSSRKDTNAASN